MTVSLRPRVGFRRSFGIGICLKPVRYCPVRLSRVGHHLLGRAFGHHLAAMDAGARAHIHDMVGGEDRLLVMLDDDDAVAEVAEPVERLEQPRIVALMQPDGRLVQHIEHAGEARADLRGEADALALAARQRAAGAGESEVVEADIVEEVQPLADLFQDALGDLVLLRRELGGQRREPMAGLADRHVGHLADMQAVDLHRERLRLEAIAGAGLARLVGLEARQLLAHPGGFGLAPAPLDIGDHALEGLRGRVVADAVVIGESDLVLAGAVEHDVAEVLGQRLPRLGHGLAIGAGERFQRLLVIGRGGGRARPGGDGAAVEAQIFVGHDEVGLEEQLGAEPVAGGAGAIGVVEGEQPRLDLLDGEARDRAGELRREDDALAFSSPRRRVGEFDHGDAVGERKRRLEGIGEPRARCRAAPRRDPPPRRCRA